MPTSTLAVALGIVVVYCLLPWWPACASAFHSSDIGDKLSHGASAASRSQSPRPGSFAVASTQWTAPISASLSVFCDQPDVAIPADEWGVFFEEISHAGVSGLYAQQINNSNFESSTEDYTGWKPLPLPAKQGSLYLSLTTERPLTWESPRALRVESNVVAGQAGATVGVLNTGFEGISLRQQSGGYQASLWAWSSTVRQLTVSLVAANDSSHVLGSAAIADVSAQWRKFEVSIAANASASSLLAALTITWQATSALRDVVSLDVVTLLPTAGWRGLPFIRSDLAQLVADLHPSFIRMPGGGYIVGDSLRDRFEWRNSIGPLEERRGHYNPWGYWSEDGLGIFEYFLFAEQLTDAWGDPTRTVWVINPGIGNKDFVPAEHIEWWIRNTLDCIEFITGDASTTPLGAVRASMGHPAPFHLDYLAVGNENCQFGGLPSYSVIYPLFYERIKQIHPALPVIVNCNDTHFSSSTGTNLFDYYEVHTYPGASSMAEMGALFDSFSPRSQQVFLSEYSAGGNNTLNDALSEAIFMQGVERNADVVHMSSYAPLLARIDRQDWSPNLIYFNSTHSYGTPSYYNQLIFSSLANTNTTKGSLRNIRSALTQEMNTATAAPVAAHLAASATTAKLSAMNASAAVADVLVIKLTNAGNRSVSLNVSLVGLISPPSRLQGEWISLQSPRGDPLDGNSLEQPTAIVPVITATTLSAPSFHVDVNAYTIAVLRLFLSMPDRQTSIASQAPARPAPASAAAAASAAALSAPVRNMGSFTYDQLGGQPYNVSYDARALTINGQRVFLLAAGVHYPRSTPSMWPQMMKDIRSAGLNCVQSYWFHNYHEEQQGVWDWSTESRNLGGFLQAAADAGLFVTLRLGVYVDAEWFNGGVAAWTRGKGFQYRDPNPGWLQYMGDALRIANEYLRPYLAVNGGPIIITQIENEYHIGSDPRHLQYMAWMQQLIAELNTSTVWIMCAATDAPAPIIYTCNGGGCEYYVPDQQDKRQQPAMWSENWVAWFQLWGGPPQTSAPAQLAFTVAQFAAAGGVYQSYYMYHGGTNFGRTASASVTTSYAYDAQLDEYGVRNEPHYSHQARLHGVLNAIAPSLLAYPFAMPQTLQSSVVVYEYGSIGQADSVAIFSCTNRTATSFSYRGNEYRINNASIQIYNASRMTMMFDTSVVLPPPGCELTTDAAALSSSAASSIVWSAEPVGIWSGQGVRSNGTLDQVDTTLYLTNYMWYVTTFQHDATVGVDPLTASPTQLNLSITNAGDNELFFIDSAYVGRGNGASGNAPTNYLLNLSTPLPSGSHSLQVLSVMMGMSDYGDAFAKKGLNGDVLLEGRNLTTAQSQWTQQVGLLGETLDLFTTVGARSYRDWKTNWSSRVSQPLTWYWLNVSTPQPAGDAGRATWHYDMGGMGKGQLYCNGLHLGAYWNVRDKNGRLSQQFYHMPRDYLLPPGQINTVVVFEEVGGDPTTVRLLQRNAFTDTDPQQSPHPFAYQGSRHSKPAAQRGPPSVSRIAVRQTSL